MTGMGAADLRVMEARIETLLVELGEHPDRQVATRAEELVGLLVRVYGTGLSRVVGIAADHDPALLHRFAADGLVASLLMVHGLHPVDVGERVRRALDEVRPRLGSHGGGLELVEVDDAGLVRLRMAGGGCRSSAGAVREAVERAIRDAAPEVARVDVEEAPPAPRLIPVESLLCRPSTVDSVS